MSLGIFVGLCVIGSDLLIYFLFQWMYGENRAAIARRVASRRRAIDQQQQGGLFLVHSRKTARLTHERI